MNPMPVRVKQMLAEDPVGILNQLKSESHPLSIDRRIWCYPRLPSQQPETGLCLAMTDQELFEVSLDKLNEVLPDPREFCVGVYLPEYDSDGVNQVQAAA